MDTWLILLISGAVPAAITVAGPHLSKRLKARQAARKTDAEIGAELRDELRDELDRLKTDNIKLRDRVAVLEGRVAQQASWIVRLEAALRTGAPDAFVALEQFRRDYLDEAAG